MNKLNIDAINQDRIKIDIQDTDKGVMIVFSGDIDMEDPSIILDPLFDKVHKGAAEKHLNEVTVDLKQLNFLNSSGIKALAKWIMKLNAVSDDQKYNIRILHNKEITWQVTSLPTLTFLVPGIVKVE